MLYLVYVQPFGTMTRAETFLPFSSNSRRYIRQRPWGLRPVNFSVYRVFGRTANGFAGQMPPANAVLPFSPKRTKLFPSSCRFSKNFCAPAARYWASSEKSTE